MTRVERAAKKKDIIDAIGSGVLAILLVAVGYMLLCFYA